MSQQYISLWPFYYRKNDCITYQDKTFQRLLEEEVSAKNSPYFLPVPSPGVGIKAGFGSQEAERCCQLWTGLSYPLIPTSELFRATVGLGFLLSQSWITSKFSPTIPAGFSFGPLSDISAYLLGWAVALLITTVAVRGAVSTETEPVKDLPAIPCLTIGFLRFCCRNCAQGALIYSLSCPFLFSKIYTP